MDRARPTGPFLALGLALRKRLKLSAPIKGVTGAGRAFKPLDSSRTSWLAFEPATWCTGAGLGTVFRDGWDGDETTPEEGCMRPIPPTAWVRHGRQFRPIPSMRRV